MASSLPSFAVFAEIFQIFGRKNCKGTIFALENGIFTAKSRLALSYTLLDMFENSRDAFTAIHLAWVEKDKGCRRRLKICGSLKRINAPVAPAGRGAF